LHVLVISDKLVASYPLPDTGEVRIGRSPQCEIVIDDASISRVHANLIIGPPLQVRDLGSANGTRIRDRQLSADKVVAISAGEPVQIGTATIIVQRQAAPIRPRRLWTHDYFEFRLEEECARAARKGWSFSVLRLTATSPSPEALQDALTDLVRLSDVVGDYGPNDYEVLLVDTGPEELELAIARIVGELHKHNLEVRIGSAVYPRDGRTPDALLSRAGEIARGAKASEAVSEGNVVVADRAMRDMYALADRLASGKITVLILGETGVGKEVLAEHVHRRSPRARQPYLRLNCAALSETLLESELFGYERGAFTGAVGTKQGLLETANGGTVFLDEVGELPHSVQVKLLRVIEERMLLRVGGLKPRPIDVRFIAATNRDLEAEVTRGTFRQDLFFRLNGATLVIPPLRERTDEVPALTRMFVTQASRQLELAHEPQVSQEALNKLVQYSWPGNIRELRNVIERAVLLCADGPILPTHLPLEKMRATFATPTDQVDPPRPATPPAPTPTPTPTATPSILRRGKRLVPDVERERIEQALAECGGNQTRAAKLLGIGRRTLVSRLRELAIARPHD
jgi:two-component system, NtrC family, response regulator AtoC